MSFRPFFSIIITSLNGASVIERALDSVRGLDYDNYETIVVDNGSTDNLAQIVAARYPEVQLIQSPVNLGFAGGNNLGLRQAAGDVLVLLNDDTEVRPDWLGAWARAAAENPGWGVLGCKLLYPDERTIQHAGGIIWPNGNTNHLGYEEEDDGRFDDLIACDYVTGAAMAIRREVFDLVGPLDEKYFPIYFEETDYCLQTRRAGYQVLYVPGAVVIHHESRTQAAGSFRFQVRYTRCRMRFLAKNYSRRELLGALKKELHWWWRPFSRKCYLPFFCGYMLALCDLPTLLSDRVKAQRRQKALLQKNERATRRK